MTIRLNCWLLLATFTLTACERSQTELSTEAAPAAVVHTAQPEDEALAAAGAFMDAYDNPTGLDSHTSATVRPQDDFFDYVNARWIEATEIPADRVSWGVFEQIHALNEERQRALIETMANEQGASAGSPAQLVGDFYRSLTDRELVNSVGMEPLAQAMDEVDAIADYAALARYFGSANTRGGAAPLAIDVDKDFGGAPRYMVSLWQSGLTLPDREYYLSDDAKFVAIREAFPAYVEKLSALAGLGFNAERAAGVVAIEQRLAEHHWERSRNRDIEAMYNVVSVSALAQTAPEFDWRDFLEGAGLAGRDELILAQLDYFQGLGADLKAFPLTQWQDYLRFHLVNDVAMFLGDDIQAARFDFIGRTVYGLEEDLPTWKRAVRTINGAIGEAVGQVYVETYFPADHKQRMTELVDNLMETFRVRIQSLAWMSEPTRAKAELKRAALARKIGYPDRWRDYSSLQISASDPIGNLRRAERFDYEVKLSRLDQAIDRDEWFMTPQTVNAYHNPLLNEIVFPAGILQPPMFNMVADDATNYGAIGMVIGHEIGHAFDDMGRKFGPDGGLDDWWTPEDAERFKQTAARLVDQYAAFEPVPGMHINGELTLGENIADLTGLTIAYHAYHLSLGGAEAPVIDGLTGDQRFFLSYAQVWRGVTREETLRSRLVTDPHSPDRYRINGALPNFAPFYDAFGVREGDGMYLAPERRVTLW